MMLLIDAGNTRLKWAFAHDGALRDHGEIFYRHRVLDEALAPLLGVETPAERVLISNVAGTAVATRLEAIANRRFGCAAEFARVRGEAFGLRVAYDPPERLGVDRWLAMLGALAAQGTPILVADLGTAVTVDAVDAEGQHLGGAIAPGVYLMKESLFSETSDIRHGGATVDIPELFARTTGAAVSAGASYAAVGLIDRALSELERRLAGKASLVLTGGDAETLRPLIGRPAVLFSDLVLRGLVVYAG